MSVEPIVKPLSIGGLAARLGAPRQRIYGMVQKGQIRAVQMAGGLVVPPEEANRVIDAAVRIDTNSGRSRLVFNFI